MKTPSTAGALLGALVLAFTPSVRAALTAVGPFTGTASESFEEFPNYADAGFVGLAEPASVFGGFGTVSSTGDDIMIYQPGTADFGIGSANAQVADGVRGAGLNSPGDAFHFTFAHPISAFGGYFGAANDSFFSGDITFNFSDASSRSFTYSDPNGTGALDWLGWTSDVGLTSVDISGDFVVADALQVDAKAPDATPTVLALALGLVALACARAGRTRAHSPIDEQPA